MSRVLSDTPLCREQHTKKKPTAVRRWALKSYV